MGSASFCVDVCRGMCLCCARYERRPRCRTELRVYCAAATWLVDVAAAGSLRDPPRLHTLRYEELVQDPVGVQPEAFFFRIPCSTLRAETEWVELVEHGWNCLVVPSTASVVGEYVA